MITAILVCYFLINFVMMVGLFSTTSFKLTMAQYAYKLDTTVKSFRVVVAIVILLAGLPLAISAVVARCS